MDYFGLGDSGTAPDVGFGFDPADYSLTNTSNLSTAQLLDELATLHQTVVASNFGTLTTGTGSGGNIEVKLPWIDEPNGSLPIATQNGLALPAIDGAFHTLVSVTCPTGWDAICDGIQFNLTTNAFTDFSGDVLWQLLLDGRPIDGFQALTNQRGNITQPMKIHTIKFKSGSVLSIVVQHVNNVGLGGNVIGGIFGYKYPRIGGTS